MRRSVHLRRWQHDALQQFTATPQASFLAVATPGAGKTTFALAAAVDHLGQRPHERLVVVCPTRHLTHQWADAAHGFGLHLDPEWSRSDPFPRDMHGIVVTYQQVAADPDAVARAADGAFVVLDEIHHAGDERAWGDALRVAFGRASRRLSLSGTPFRSDTAAIPFVRYDFDEAVADYVYGYREALREGGVVRPVYFPRRDGRMEWTSPDGRLQAATFADRLDRTGVSQRLRTALSVDGDWLPAVLGQADGQLRRLRADQPDAAGLVIAIDLEHARGIAALMADCLGVQPVVATSDDPRATDRIAAFARGDASWIVAVRMVSEGVDIPRLGVAVYATTTVTELFFRQAVGRVVRWRSGRPRQRSYVFIPDDARLRTFAARLAEERTHSLRRAAADVAEEEEPAAERADDLPREQLSLFQALSATPLDSAGDGLDPGGDTLGDVAFGDLARAGDGGLHDAAGPTIEVELPAPPPTGGPAGPPTVSRSRRKRELRRLANDRVHMLAHLTGLDRKQIHTRLNTDAGITAVADATLHQLEARLRAADRWIGAL